MTKESSRGALTLAEDDTHLNTALEVRSLSRKKMIDGMNREVAAATATVSSGAAFKNSFKIKSNFFSTRKRSLNPSPGANTFY